MMIQIGTTTMFYASPSQFEGRQLGEFNNLEQVEVIGRFEDKQTKSISVTGEIVQGGSVFYTATRLEVGGYLSDTSGQPGHRIESATYSKNLAGDFGLCKATLTYASANQ